MTTTSRWCGEAINANTQEIIAHTLTSNAHGDAGQVEPLLDKIDRPVQKLYGDGGYDHWHLYQTLDPLQTSQPLHQPRHAKIRLERLGDKACE